jgi:hypothetical protein
MKKIAMIALIAMTSAAFAADVTVSGIVDHKDSFRVSTEVKGLTVSATHVDQILNRYAVGKDVTLTKIGPVSLAATGAVVYQDSARGENGYGLTVGAKATYPITKSVSAVVGAEHFIGQSRISAYDGKVVTVGLNVKF